MRNLIVSTCILAAVTAAAFSVVNRVAPGRQPDGSYLVPTGQWLTPAGRHVEVNDRPLGMAVSPDGRTLAVTTGSNFQPRRLHILNTEREAEAQSIDLGDSFAGVAFSSNGERLYIGGGRGDNVKIFRVRQGQYEIEKTISLPGSAPSGLCLSADGATLYVALNLKHAVAAIDLQSGTVRETPVGSFPYTAVLAAGGAELYASNWGGRRPRSSDVTDGMFPVVVDPRTGIPSTGTVSVIDTRTGAPVAEIDTGLHPSALAASPDGARVYVANANSDTISVIDTASGRVSATISVVPFRKAPLGSSPNALALSPDGRTLYAANGANNAIAVLDVSRAQGVVKGFIPTGWYPTAVAASPDGKRLFVASGYGFGSIAPSPAGQPGRRYSDRKGVVSMMPAPSARQLEAFTRQVLANNRVGAKASRPAAGHPVPMQPGRPSPIKHVFFIIKENRTYDQVFGALPQGNGDPSLVHFGRDVTPNHHALAERYVLLDNYYAPGDQSALGHRWCTQGYAGDWGHKYGNARNDQNPMLYAPTDFIWDHAKAHGISVRSYGERGLNTITPPKATWTGIYNDWKNKTGAVTIQPRAILVGLRDVYSPRYPAYELRVPDQVRADVFLSDLDGFEKTGALPRLVVLLLPQNHTAGTTPGFPTPRAMVADNDLALGRIVEAISKSRFWKESVIFVTEDDAQAGLDHVDGHRTVGLVIGPYVRRKAVDSTFYTTINMFRTIEQILGLPPLNQFDLAAEPMFSVFTSEADYQDYAVLRPQVPLDEMNKPLSALQGLERQLALESLRMDLDEPDAAPEQLLDRVVWHSVKGFDRPFPRAISQRLEPARSQAR